MGAQAVKPKSSPRTRKDPDASTDRGLIEGSGEVFFLDILSHRMSEIASLEKSRNSLQTGGWRGASFHASL